MPPVLRRWADDGSVLAVVAVSALALAGSVRRDWSWTGRVSSFPSVNGRDGRRYHYRGLPGGQAEIYLPSGRMVVHHVSSAAARQGNQLAEEVKALVDDLYVEQG